MDFADILGIPSNTSSPSSGLSAGAIGGIVGGILGALLLISVAVTGYLLGRRHSAGTAIPNPPEVGAPAQKQEVKSAVIATPDLEAIMAIPEANAADSEPGGRLRYPNESVQDGGRLGSTI